MSETPRPGHGLKEYVALLDALDGRVVRVGASDAPFTRRLGAATPAAGVSDETETLIRQVAQEVTVSELAHRGL